MKKKLNQPVSTSTRFFSASVNKNKLPIVLWIILITSGAIFLTPDVTISMMVSSVFLTLFTCIVMFVNTEIPVNNKLRVLYDLIQLGCILLLIITFGFWGLAYSIFFLAIIIFDAFNYSAKEYAAVFLMTILGLGIVWLVQDPSVFETAAAKNTFFLVVGNTFFASAILARILAKNSLSMQARERELLKNKQDLARENVAIKVVLDNMENAIIALDENNAIKFANEKNIDFFSAFRSKDESEIDINGLMLIDAKGLKRSLSEFVNSSEECVSRSDLSVRIDGGIKNINIAISKSLDANDKYQGAVVSIRNLSSNEVLEKSKIEFSSLASHEIRTPLTAIDGYTYLMLNSDKFVFNDLTREYLNLLHETTTDLIKLANSILQMSKLDDGSIRVDIEPVDLSVVINDICKDETKAASAKGLTIECDISKVSMLDTDKIKVTEIITNILQNAIKFTNDGAIKMILDQVGDEIYVSIQDSGIGIPKSSKDKLFSKFYQVESYDTRKNSGSGLGLYLSRALAKRLGGDLVLEDSNNKGSKFSLILPVKYPFSGDLEIRKDRKLKEFIEGF